ncbi:hypothetical protein GGQ67_003741 [Rhizobium metallidurans]|uniref:Uncharacterized protein n=1 Tax=Rhizobium metallidurans TaxID=1265931 RepID=A0A7W6CRX7_9HYPH|nr:hypothetical protein [Rhizobium metallidurans]
MIVLGLGACFLAVAVLTAVALLDRIEAGRIAMPVRVL